MPQYRPTRMAKKTFDHTKCQQGCGASIQTASEKVKWYICQFPQKVKQYLRGAQYTPRYFS